MLLGHLGVLQNTEIHCKPPKLFPAHCNTTTIQWNIMQTAGVKQEGGRLSKIWCHGLWLQRGVRVGILLTAMDIIFQILILFPILHPVSNLQCFARHFLPQIYIFVWNFQTSEWVSVKMTKIGNAFHVWTFFSIFFPTPSKRVLVAGIGSCQRQLRPSMHTSFLSSHHFIFVIVIITVIVIIIIESLSCIIDLKNLVLT